jgi:hypothetical protein
MRGVERDDMKAGFRRDVVYNHAGEERYVGI